MTTTKRIRWHGLAWHFVACSVDYQTPGAGTLDALAWRPVLRDRAWAGRVGDVETARGKLVMCRRGLHASTCVLDALDYSPGPYVRLVEPGGEIYHDNDKLVSRHRRIVAEADATRVLDWFARYCAFVVADLWGASNAARRYLERGTGSADAVLRSLRRGRSSRRFVRDVPFVEWHARNAAEEAIRNNDVRLRAAFTYGHAQWSRNALLDEDSDEDSDLEFRHDMAATLEGALLDEMGWPS